MKNATFHGMVDGEIRKLYPKTSASNVIVDEETTLDEKLEELAKTSNQVHSDWDQNSPVIPSHIKNRTHYSEYKKDALLYENTIQFDDVGRIELNDRIGLEEGKHYVLTLNGKNYTLKCVSVTSGTTREKVGVALGSLYPETSAVPNFDIHEYLEEEAESLGYSLYIRTLDTTLTEATFSIYSTTETVHKLDAKYLPEDIGNSPIKPFPITKGVQPNYDLVVLPELEDKTFYYLEPSSHDKTTCFSADGEYIIYRASAVSSQYIYYHEKHTSDSIGGTVSGGNEQFLYYADSQNNIIGKASRNSDYLGARNTEEFTPFGDYNPATKKYVDDTTASVVADALANLDVSPIKPFPVAINELGDSVVYVTQLEDNTFYCLDKADSDVNYYFANGSSFSHFDRWDVYYNYRSRNPTYTDQGFLRGRNSTYMYHTTDGIGKVNYYGGSEYIDKDGLDYGYTPSKDWHPTDKRYVDNAIKSAIDGIVFPEIPEIPEPVQGDWNQNDPTADDYIKNRTHWVESNGTNTLEWDGNTDGLASFSPDGETTLHKVTDFFVGKDDLVGGTVTISGVMDINITEEMIVGEAGDGFELYMAGYNGTLLLLTANQDITIEGLAIEKGTYFLSMGAAGHVSKVTLLTPAFGEKIVHKIDPKFLPEGGFGYDDSKELLPESTHTFTEEMDFMAPLRYSLGLKVGESYTVNWNGTEYSCVGVTFEMEGLTIVAIGDADVFTTGEPTGEYPFLIMDFPAEMVAEVGFHAAVMGLDGSESATVKVIEESIHTIDPKFGTVFRVNVWHNGYAYVADKTYAEIKEAENNKYPIVGTYTNKAGRVYTMIGCDESAEEFVRLAAFDVSGNFKVYSIRIGESGYVGVNVSQYEGINVDE